MFWNKFKEIYEYYIVPEELNHKFKFQLQLINLNLYINSICKLILANTSSLEEKESKLKNLITNCLISLAIVEKELELEINFYTENLINSKISENNALTIKEVLYFNAFCQERILTNAYLDGTEKIQQKILNTYGRLIFLIAYYNELHLNKLVDELSNNVTFDNFDYLSKDNSIKISILLDSFRKYSGIELYCFENKEFFNNGNLFKDFKNTIDFLKDNKFENIELNHKFFESINISNAGKLNFLTPEGSICNLNMLKDKTITISSYYPVLTKNEIKTLDDYLYELRENF